MEKINEEAKKLMALAGIKEGNKKFLTNESFSEINSVKSDINQSEDFIVLQFEQEDVEPGQDDDLYKIG